MSNNHIQNKKNYARKHKFESCECCRCEGTSPLMVAAANGHSYLVEQLLTQGADREAQDKQGLTAQQLAVKGGHLNLVPLLDLPAHGKVARLSLPLTEMLIRLQ